MIVICQKHLNREELVEYCKPYKFVIGIDEVGWGAIAGPVTLGAVAMVTALIDHPMLEWKDSKKYYSENKRASHAEEVKKYAMEAKTLHISPRQLEKYGPGPALYAGVKSLLNYFNEDYSNTLVVLDGTFNLDLNVDLDIISVPKADANCKAVSAASIIAKVERDDIMYINSHFYPKYEWESNKGYPSAKHLAALKTYGISEHHRKNINTVRKALQRKGYYATETTPAYQARR